MPSARLQLPKKSVEYKSHTGVGKEDGSSELRIRVTRSILLGGQVPQGAVRVVGVVVGPPGLASGSHDRSSGM